MSPEKRLPRYFMDRDKVLYMRTAYVVVFPDGEVDVASGEAVETWGIDPNEVDEMDLTKAQAMLVEREGYYKPAAKRRGVRSPYTAMCGEEYRQLSQAFLAWIREQRVTTNVIAAMADTEEAQRAEDGGRRERHHKTLADWLERIRWAFGREQFSGKEVEKKLGCSYSYARDVVQRLTDAGELEKVGRGRWRSA